MIEPQPAARCDGPAALAVTHREEEYDSRSFAMLRKMQSSHFWYRGRHRFLLHAVHRAIMSRQAQTAPLRVVDLGGGCGGWIDYLLARKRFPTSEIALADSAEPALSEAALCLPAHIARYQIDLLDLRWSSRWDMAFLLDVLEHIPDHARALAEIHQALAPGGLLFITVPALDQFWTWNDEFCLHQRRYSRPELISLATQCGFRALDARYFLFFLSPLLLASRLFTGGKARSLTESQRRSLAIKMHAVPHPLVNVVLSAIFASETPLGHHVRFPWGTSLLAVLEKRNHTNRMPMSCANRIRKECLVSPGCTS